MRSHTEERPYVCEWPGCKKGFARQHDCKSVLSSSFLFHGSHFEIYARRHQALHAAKSQSNICQGCKKTFSRLDALNVSSFVVSRSILIIDFTYRDTVSALSFQLKRCPTLFLTVRSDGGAECRQHNPKFAASLATSQQTACPPHPLQMPPLPPPQ